VHDLISALFYQKNVAVFHCTLKPSKRLCLWNSGI